MGFILSYGEAVYSTTSLLGLASSEGLAFTAGEYFSTSLKLKRKICAKHNFLIRNERMRGEVLGSTNRVV